MPIILDPRAAIDFELADPLAGHAVLRVEERGRHPATDIGGPTGLAGLLAAWRWARAVERRYRRMGPAGLDPAGLPVLGSGDDT